MPTSARLKLEFEQGQCPHCGTRVELEFGGLPDERAQAQTESSPCPECGGEIMSERRGSRFWYTPEEFGAKDTPARRVLRGARQWLALAVELRLAASAMPGVDEADLSDLFAQAEAAQRRAMAAALDRARGEVPGRGCLPRQEHVPGS